MSVNIPNKMPVPFANAGLKNTIPPTTDNVNGLAGYSAGFGSINMTPKTAGGIPPFGQDFNGILFAITESLRFFQAGSIYTYDSTFSTAVGGYRAGARVLRTDGTGYWLNLTDGNTNDPEAAGALAAGWVPDYTYGIAVVTMTNANVTLTPNQYGKPIIVITGALTANLNLIFPDLAGQWSVINNTTGAFSITVKTASGSGVVVEGGTTQLVYGDGTNINQIIGQASESQAGIIQIATTLQAQGFTNDAAALTAKKLADAFKGANQLLAASGYQKLPGGLILQWKQQAMTTTVSPYSFPTTFPTAVLCAGGFNNNSSSTIVTVQPISTSQFNAGASIASTNHVFAVGF